MGFWKKKDSEYSSEDKPAVEAPELKKSTPAAVASPSKDEPAEIDVAPKSGGGSLEERFGRLRSALGPGTVIQGKLSFDTPVRIDGRLSGEVFSSKALIVGETGSIDADVQVQSLVVMGKVTGLVKATERVELMSGGSIEADVFSPVIIVQEGSQLNGKCVMKRSGDGSKKPGQNDSSTASSVKASTTPSGNDSKKSLHPDEKVAGAR